MRLTSQEIVDTVLRTYSDIGLNHIRDFDCPGKPLSYPLDVQTMIFIGSLEWLGDCPLSESLSEPVNLVFSLTLW